MSNVYYQYKRLTPKEKIYIRKNPHHTFAIKEAKEIALKATEKIFGLNGRNDKSDAFRHCFWSAILAKEIGYQNARKLTSSHESGASNPEKEKNMDLHNNAIGLRIGRRAGKSNIVIKRRCISALNDKKLIVINDKSEKEK